MTPFTSAMAIIGMKRTNRRNIEKNRPKTRDEFTQTLGTLKDFDGATGQTRFDDKREAQKPLFLLTIDPKGIKEIPLKAKTPAG